ncbi:MAG: cytochrome oxidase small assembly protein [Betaproteobacteria bacterium]|nr:cytochrome oxidase small assembly protein [Betaproteobacteria bacterium]
MSQNARTGLILATIALAFFVGLVVKQALLGS